MAADVHQFVPVMWNDHSPEPYRKSKHLDSDLADRAIEWITGHKSLDSELPFMMLWASGSMHSPRHAPDDYIDKYKGKFDQGWDKVREEIIENQKKPEPPKDVKKNQRAYLGVSLMPVTPVIRNQLGLSEGEGILVGGVKKDSPAAKSGIRKWDVI